MKRLVSFFVAAVCLAGATESQAGLGDLFAVKVSGTIQQQGPNETIITSRLDNQRIFDDAGVTPEQYELVLSFLGPNGIELLPKSSAAKLPTILVFSLDDLTFLFSQKPHQERFCSPISSPAASGPFQGLVGAMTGVIRFKAGEQNSVSISGEGSSSVSGSLFRFKVSTHGFFVQSP
jgi:hypothetical protein